jgi:hypothetical protein
MALFSPGREPPHITTPARVRFASKKSFACAVRPTLTAAPRSAPVSIGSWIWVAADRVAPRGGGACFAVPGRFIRRGRSRALARKGCAARSLRSMKFIFKTTRAKTPIVRSGRTVTHAPALSPTAAEKRANAESAKGEIRVDGNVPDLPADAPNAAEDEWTAGEAELDGLRQTGRGYRHGAERHAKGDPDEERNEMRFVEFLSELPTAAAALSRSLSRLTI